MYRDCNGILCWMLCCTWILKLSCKNKNGTIPLYFHNFLVAETVPVDPQRYNFRHKRRVIILIPPKRISKTQH